MTILQLYEAVLIELNKVKAPSLSLTDFVYFVNKAVQQYQNSIYNMYEVNQQKVDDLRVVRGSVKLNLTPVTEEPGVSDVYGGTLFENVYYTYLPEDYYHILNCIVGFKVPNKSKCNETYSLIYQGARRLSSDSNPQVINNYYFRPSYKNPYYYINNVNVAATDERNSISAVAPTFILETSNLPSKGFVTLKFSNKEDESLLIPKLPCNSDSIVPIYRTLLKQKNDRSELHGMKIDLIDDDTIELSLLNYNELFYEVNGKETPINKSDVDTDFIKNRESYTRYGNNSKVRMEIRFGEGNKKKHEDEVTAEFVLVDYLKAPQRIQLTQDQIDDIEDNTQNLEFPDYVIYEIINMTVKLVMENATDMRLQTNPAISDTIAPITQTQK